MHFFCLFNFSIDLFEYCVVFLCLQDSQLTDRERAERNYKKRLLDLAKKHDKAGEIEKVQR